MLNEIECVHDDPQLVLKLDWASRVSHSGQNEKDACKRMNLNPFHYNMFKKNPTNIAELSKHEYNFGLRPST